ncbi:MAG: entericidin A/B family lipoprotein [Phycisphaerae bacterium]|nr:entericidin A/B family lipoprotein [Phycisphaerae bacterium]
MRTVRVLLLWCLLAAAAVAAVGCNTIEGMGEDIELAGQAIQDACR